VLAGCASTKTVTLKSDALRGHEGGTVAVSSHEKPGFVAMTAGKAAFGMLGAMAMISAGNQIVSDNQIADPAENIGSQLVADLAALNTLKISSKAPAVAKTGDTSALAKLYGDSDVLLDVQTVGWGFSYFPTDWNSYRVTYNAKARVIETRGGKLLAEASCVRVPENGPEAPSYDQLTSNGAAGLKAELKKAAEQCLGEFRSKLLGI
jgi:hypothetical protein